MTQKELLYLEDATCHEQSIKDILMYFLEKTNNKKIAKFIEGEIKVHTNLHQMLLKHMEDEANEW